LGVRSQNEAGEERKRKKKTGDPYDDVMIEMKFKRG